MQELEIYNPKLLRHCLFAGPRPTTEQFNRLTVGDEVIVYYKNKHCPATITAVTDNGFETDKFGAVTKEHIHAVTWKVIGRMQKEDGK